MAPHTSGQHVVLTQCRLRCVLASDTGHTSGHGFAQQRSCRQAATSEDTAWLARCVSGSHHCVSGRQGRHGMPSVCCQLTLLHTHLQPVQSRSSLPAWLQQTLRARVCGSGSTTWCLAGVPASMAWWPQALCCMHQAGLATRHTTAYHRRQVPQAYTVIARGCDARACRGLLRQLHGLQPGWSRPLVAPEAAAGTPSKSTKLAPHM
jgi:hypothetical protein